MHHKTGRVAQGCADPEAQQRLACMTRTSTELWLRRYIPALRICAENVLLFSFVETGASSTIAAAYK
jgi:hypothetical protein